jgi:hypothetical protein
MRKPMTRDVTKETLKDNVDVDPVTGCWIWKWAKHDAGYGMKQHRGKVTRVHRIAYELFAGEIPVGLHVCHRCDCRPCCNPEHLFLGTDMDNQRDSQMKGRNKIPPPCPGSLNGFSKLTESSVAAIKSMLDAGGRLVDIARKFCVHRCTIGDIKYGRRWRHVVGEPA